MEKSLLSSRIEICRTGRILFLQYSSKALPGSGGLCCAHWRSVTVLCQDSGLADALSAALFLLPLEEGRALAEGCGAEALWLDGEGNAFMLEGFRAQIRS